MTHLRKMMLEELQRRNYAQSTVKAYVRIIQEFANHFHQPPDKLGPQHLRQYQAYLFQEKKSDSWRIGGEPNSCHSANGCWRSSRIRASQHSRPERQSYPLPGCVRTAVAPWS